MTTVHSTARSGAVCIQAKDERHDAAIVALTAITRGLTLKLKRIVAQESGSRKASPARSYWLGKRHGIEAALVVVELAVDQLLKEVA